MVFKKGKKFTNDGVKEVLKEGDKSLPQIREILNCSQSTAEKLIKEMLGSGEIQRKDYGSREKPFYVYYLHGVNHPHPKVWACPVRDMGN